MNTLGIALVWCLLQVTAVSLAGGAVYWLASKVGAGRLAAIASLGLVLGLTVAALSPWPSWLHRGQTALAVPADVPLAGQANSKGEQEAAPDGTDSVEPSRGPFNAVYWQSIWTRLMRPQTTEAAGQLASKVVSWPAVVAAALLLMALVGLLRLLAAAVFLRRLARESNLLEDRQLTRLADSLACELSIPYPVPLKESATLPTAATFGHRRPVVLLPVAWREWPAEQVRAVLAHELAHVARRDFFFGLIGQLAVAIHFYHPLVHWLARRLRLEQELAADAVAAHLVGGQEAYLQCLAALTLRADRVRVGWAAQTFLPTRSLFVRRIEMLKRTKKLQPDVLPSGARAAVLGALVVIGLAAVGLRGPGAASGPLVAAEPARKDEKIVAENTFVSRTAMEPDKRAAFDAKTDMGIIPEDAFYVVRIRPAEIFKDPSMQPIAKEVSQLLARQPGGDVFSVSEIDTVLMAVYGTIEGGFFGMRTLFRTVQPVSQAKADRFIQTRWLGSPVKVEHPMGPYYHQKGDPEGPAYWRIGDRTFLFDSSARHLKQYLNRLQSGTMSPRWLGGTEPIADTQVWLALNTPKISLPSDQDGSRSLVGGFPLQMVSPLLRETQRVVASVQIAPVIRVAADAACPSPEAARHVEETTQALLVLARNVLAEQLQAAVPAGTPQAAFAPMGRLIEQLLKEVKVESADKHVLLSVSKQLQASAVYQTLSPAIGQARKASLRAQSITNLKRIALAMLNYESAHGHYPPSVLYDKKTGTPYSWRVAILPYMEQNEIFKRYRFNEPWDSEHNKQVLEYRPIPLLSPTDPTSTNAAYFGLVSPETLFTGKDGTKNRAITDGTSNTLLVVEAKQDIPWTKPEDIPYAHDGPLPKLGGFFPGGFHAAFADGYVRFLSAKLKPETLRHLIEKADGHVVNRAELKP